MSPWLISVLLVTSLFLLWLDYYTLSKASQIYLKTKQRNTVLLQVLLLSVLSGTALHFIDSEFFNFATPGTGTNLNNFRFSPYSLLYLIAPPLIYHWLLRNQSGQKLSVRQTLSLYAIKLALYIAGLLGLLLVAGILLYILFSHDS